MLRRTLLLALSALALSYWGGAPSIAQQTEPRIAFVVGNSGYTRGELPTALNDAGLVAEALRSIGFEIVEGANLSQPDLVRAFRGFLAKVDASGPDALAVVYFSGHALPFEGDNFLLGIDARLVRESDIPIEAVRLSDLLRPLADSPARAKVVMIDAARQLPFRPQGRGLARGLEAVDAPQGMLIAFATAPGTVVPDRPGAYGAFATAIAEMLRAPGIDLETAFTHIRSRTHLSTDGQQTPWYNSALGEQIQLVPPQAAIASAFSPPPPPRERRPMRDIGPDESYALAIEMDTLEGYVAFVDAYPRHPYSQRVWAMIRARREALAWMRAQQSNSPPAYWTYLRRYPNGMYAFDAERRLRRLRSSFAPPPGFAMMEFDDVPIALIDEPIDYVEVYRVGPPPPRLLFRPPPAFFVSLPPPRLGLGPRALPGLSSPIPVVPLLGPAPRLAPSGGSRPPGLGPRRGSATTTPGLAPGVVAPSTAIAPSTVAPSTVSPPPGGPGSGRPPGGGLPPGSATTTPGVVPGARAPGTAIAPTTVAPSTVAPSTVSPPPGGPGAGRPPGGDPRPGTASRTPPGAPGAATGPGVTAPGVTAPGATAPGKTAPGPIAPRAVTTPGSPPPGAGQRPAVVPPPGAGRPSGPPPTAVARPTPPPPPAARIAPPPRPAAPPPAAPAKPPQCPAGKTFKDGACR